MTTIDTRIIKASKLISGEVGILSHVMKMPRLNKDPNMISYGIWASKTTELGGEHYGGRSSGCGWEWEEAMMGTVGETVERYCCAFYDLDEAVYCSYKDLPHPAIAPSEYALFHPDQYEQEDFLIKPFTDDIPLHWFKCTDLTTGKDSWCPGTFVYLPFSKDGHYITYNSSTGLSAHTDMDKALLTSLYEVIERDSFVITWLQKILPPKIKISADIQNYLDEHFPTSYEWHFFDISYDIDVPTVFGICYGEAEYGPFIGVGSSSRATYGEAVKKTIKEIAQAIPYFRYLLGSKKDWKPDDDYNKLINFEDHSLFYTMRKDLQHVLDPWKNAKATKDIDFNEARPRKEKEEIKHILTLLKDAGCNVLFKDITTPDVNDLGFYAVKVFVPQLIQLSGGYRYYFNGGKRLYEVPKKMVYTSHDYWNINKYPHPFP